MQGDAESGIYECESSLETKAKGKKLKAIYTLHPGTPYKIRSVKYDIQDENIAKILDFDNPKKRYLLPGNQFTVNRLDAERKRITTVLMDNGYYRFHKDFIQYSADSASVGHGVDITLHLLKYRANSDAPETLHPRYMIRNVNFLNNDSDKIHLREKVWK